MGYQHPLLPSDDVRLGYDHQYATSDANTPVATGAG
eukprot:CAMPEP_0197535584 /NCGR_PEP_ID=MMETSP1318-20131121/51090_1 /TAXON_ID=552666 /ORGANISM="Partenskyella glossopodia, Strain RCC365" /LENGTH=35 /DNA_ID= /DNA_START= /DNA_END= /DNA_ORIENTATION=